MHRTSGLLIAGIVGALLATGCSGTRDREAESSIVEELGKRQLTKQEGPFDLTARLPRGSTWVCVQGPYTEKEDFEQRTGRKAPGYEPLNSKEAFALWTYDDEGSARWIRIDRRIMDLARGSSGGPCFPIANLEMDLVAESGRLAYRLR